MNRVKKDQPQRSAVQYLRVAADDAGQRIDNFLLSRLKGLPKTRIYRLLRKGELRVNKKRIKPTYRVQPDDIVRIPPLYQDDVAHVAKPSATTLAKLQAAILYEDEHLLIINKPAGMAVHVGSTVRIGIIEALRHLYPQYPNLELAHRLDADTSGCLVLAKKKRILRELHTLLREGKVTKIYTTLTLGKWKRSEFHVNVPLHKNYQDGSKHMVEVNADGKSAITAFAPLAIYPTAALMEVKLFTGRTHQIRVHAAHQHHPVAGDDRYGDSEFNKLARQLGLKRMFLHAKQIEFTLPATGKTIKVEAPLPQDLAVCLDAFANYQPNQEEIR